MSPLPSLLFAAGLAQSASPAVALDRRPDLVQVDQLQLPVHPDPAPEEITITAPWRLVYSAAGVRTWETTLPIRPRTLFFHRAPGDMKVLRDGDALRNSTGPRAQTRAETWSYSTHALQVRRPIQDGPPQAGEYTVRYSAATKQEASLRLNDGEEPLDFVFQSRQLNDTTRSGLLLPAPASMAFSITVPQGDPVLDLTPTLLPPEMADPAQRSDGATLDVLVNGEPIADWSVQLDDEHQRRVSLSKWAGQDVVLTLQTGPGSRGDATQDHVFITDPIVFVPSDDPQRIVVLFLDTLRQDHLSVYGYPRETTPNLDQWAETAAVFEQARSIAPWTLPSARTMLTGQYPEQWSTTQSIQASLSEQGWATTFIAGNIYLSSNFEMANGWGEHRCINWPIASVQVERGVDYLLQHPDRPVFMMLHFMDMHLPYTEPPWYRYWFAGEAPEELPDYQFHISDVKNAARRMGAEGQQYVRDRYDNNLRYLDAQLARFLAHLDENDTVIVLADHGEEFWDHNQFEHGHTLFDELLRVPLIVRGPDFPAGRYAQPTSLLDVTPTIAMAADVPLSDSPGMPLQHLADGTQTDTFDMRPLAFGRPLYGSRRWGSLQNGVKYTVVEGRQSVFNLQSDPSERSNQAPEGMVAGRQALGEAMNTEAPIVFRVTASRPSDERQDLVAHLHVPSGIRHVWIGEDYLNRSASSIAHIDEQTVAITFEGGQKGTREVYVQPAIPAEEAISDVRLSMVVQDSESLATQSSRDWPPAFQVNNPMLLQARSGSRSIKLGYSVAPVPPEQPDQSDLSDCQRGALELEELERFVERCLELVTLGYMDELGCLDKEDELTELRRQLQQDCRGTAP